MYVTSFSEVKTDFPPHLKIKIMACINYARNFVLSSANAQFLCLPTALKREKISAVKLNACRHTYIERPNNQRHKRTRNLVRNK